MSSVLVDRKGSAHNVTSAVICEPIQGVWHITGTLDDTSPEVAGACVFRSGGAEWRGTIDPEFTGEWGGVHHYRLIAGANGWGKEIGHKGYHSDGGVKGRTVATDAARSCGETLGAFDGAGSLGVDYARPDGLASVTLEDTTGLGAYWWVGRDGVTRVGSRVSAPSSGVLDWDPESQTATLSADELLELEVGATLTDSRLGGSKKIRELQIRIKGESVRAYAWCGGGDSVHGRLPRLLQALVQRLTDGPLWGLYRYRVVSMAPDGRVNLQAVSKSMGLPDLLPVTQWPGVAGAHATLAGGAEVLVEFIEGDRAQPVITHYTPKGKGGFRPTALSLLEGTRPIACVGSPVSVFMTPGVPVAVTGTVSGNPFVGVATFSAPLRGVITAGSPGVTAP